MSAPVSRSDATRPPAHPGVLDSAGAWRLHPQVALRPEPFGALLYHFGTRKLSFLKNRTIVAVVQMLADQPDVRTACRAAGIDDADQGPYLRALAALAESKMVVPKENK
jgi:putative mycofactocin binding protein MftB